MKVVLSTKMFPPEVAAAAFRLRALTDGLAAAGHQVRVLTTRPPKTAPAQQFPNYQVHRWPVLRDAGGNVRGYVQYASFDFPLAIRLLLCSADVAIAEQPPTTGVVTALVCRLKRIPFYYYAADIWSDGVKSIGAPRIVTKTMQILERFALSRARGVIAVSDGVAERVSEFGVPWDRILVAPNGVDTDIFRHLPSETEDPYFVYTGTMSEWQGAEVFIRAMSIVREKHPNVRLKFFGQGSEESKLRAAAGRWAPEAVDFGGVIPPEETAQWISGATGALVSIVPEQGYDFAKPTKIYAAAACGTPVLFAGQGAGAELVQQNTLGLTAEYSPESVAEQMLALLNGYRYDSTHLMNWVHNNASLANTGRMAAQWITEDARTLNAV